MLVQLHGALELGAAVPAAHVRSARVSVCFRSNVFALRRLFRRIGTRSLGGDVGFDLHLRHVHNLRCFLLGGHFVGHLVSHFVGSQVEELGVGVDVGRDLRDSAHGRIRAWSDGQFRTLDLRADRGGNDQVHVGQRLRVIGHDARPVNRGRGVADVGREERDPSVPWVVLQKLLRVAPGGRGIEGGGERLAGRAVVGHALAVPVPVDPPTFDPDDPALLRGHVAGVGARVGEALAAVGALEGLLARVDAHVLLEVVLELERLAALGALELAEVGALVVRDHVALQAVDVGERLAAHAAVLGGRRVQQGQVPVQRAPPRERLVAAGALEANRLPRVPGPRVVLQLGGAWERLPAVHALEGVLLLRVDAVWGKY